jgi:zinc transporter, ZIP family
MIEAFAGMPLVLAGFLGSLIAGLGTAVGALPVLAGRGRLSDRNQALVLAAAAGIMLGATIFSLIVPALDVVTEASGSRVRAALWSNPSAGWSAPPRCRSATSSCPGGSPSPPAPCCS